MEDTICALATALPSTIAIIKVSGKDSINVVNQIFKPNNLLEKDSHSISYGYIYDNDKLVDEVLIMIMKSPKTYTKENVVEINCHGSIITTNWILKLLLANGARLAEAGEFTKRAFLNGRIDLTEAEAVNDLIASKSKSAQELAIKSLGGKTTIEIEKIRSNILSVLANIEVNIDYPEYDDIEILTNEKLKPLLINIKNYLNALLNNSTNVKVIKNGVDIAIVGKPNVGKSSLLNALIDEEKAIVTNIEGTTRDVIEGSIELNNILINLYDTAGIRKSRDLVEIIGVNKSLELIEKANLVIFVFDNSREISKEELELLEKYKNKKAIIFVNKNDLNKKFIYNTEDFPIVYGNTLDNSGLDNLKKTIINSLKLDEIIYNDNTYLSNARQISLTEKALKKIDNAINNLNNGISPDMLTIDIKESWDLLGEIIGKTYNDELLDELFSKFCIGK